MLKHYFEFLHQGVWPPKGGGGCEVRSGTIYAHELVSGIAGELMLRLKSQGRVGQAIFEMYALGLSLESRAHLMGWAPHGLATQIPMAFRAIRDWKGALVSGTTSEENGSGRPPTGGVPPIDKSHI